MINQKSSLTVLLFLLAFIFILPAKSSDLASKQIDDSSEQIPFNPNIRFGKLENGLTYYIMKNEKPEDKVELRLALNAGSIQEDDNQLGLAHFMEHMGFNGTKHFKKN